MPIEKLPEVTPFAVTNAEDMKRRVAELTSPMNDDQGYPLTTHEADRARAVVLFERGKALAYASCLSGLNFAVLCGVKLDEDHIFNGPEAMAFMMLQDEGFKPIVVDRPEGSLPSTLLVSW